MKTSARLRFLTCALLGVVLCTTHLATAGPPPTPPDSTDHPLNLNVKDVRWEKMLPDLGDLSPTFSVLHKDAKSGATRLLIRVPKNFHVTPHWHSANETHTVLEGMFVMGCMGKRDTLREEGFNYVPARMIHEAWTMEKKGALLFITVDGPWDVNFVADLPRSRSAEAVSKTHKH